MYDSPVPAPAVSEVALELAAVGALHSNNEGQGSRVPASSRNEGTESEKSENDDKESRPGRKSARTRPRLHLRILGSPASYLRLLKREFGCKLLTLLLSNYLFLKGASYHMVNSVSAPVFRELLQLPAEQHSVASALCIIPWSVKGLVGTVSDLVALAGYHKRSFMLLSAAFGVLGSALLVAFAERMTFAVAVTGFFLVMAQASFNDLLCEGAYTRKMAEKPQTGAALTSFVWMCSSLGTFIQALWVGPMVDHMPYSVVLAPFLPFTLQQVLAVAWPWPFQRWERDPGLLQEAFVQKGERVKVRTSLLFSFLLFFLQSSWRKQKQAQLALQSEKPFSVWYLPQLNLAKQHGKVFICAVALTVVAFGAVVAGLMNDRNNIVVATYWLGAGLTMVFAVWFTMPKYLAKPTLYMFLGRLLVPNIASQFSYWLRAGPECVKDGPHLSWTFMLTWNAVAQSLFAFVGVALFQRFVSKWRFRTAFLVTSLLQQLTCLFDVAMVLGWHRQLGIPDKLWYFCSAAIFEEIASMWALMPGCVLISRLCPRNIESTMYAVVVGLQNFAQSLGKFAGNFICFTVLGIRTLPTASGGCNFDSLPLAIGLCMGICPLLPISLTFCLVPNIHMNEPIIHQGEFSHEGKGATMERENEPVSVAQVAKDRGTRLTDMAFGANSSSTALCGDGVSKPATPSSSGVDQLITSPVAIPGEGVVNSDRSSANFAQQSIPGEKLNNSSSIVKASKSNEIIFARPDAEATSNLARDTTGPTSPKGEG